MVSRTHRRSRNWLGGTAVRARWCRCWLVAGGGETTNPAGSAAHVRDRVDIQQPHRFRSTAAHLRRSPALSRSRRPTRPSQPPRRYRRQWWPPTPGQLPRAPRSAAGPARLTRPALLRTAASPPRWCRCSQPATAPTCHLLVLAHAESPAVTAATISECVRCALDRPTASLCGLGT